jgi:hypothetical protein
VATNGSPGEAVGGDEWLPLFDAAPLGQIPGHEQAARLGDYPADLGRVRSALDAAHLRREHAILLGHAAEPEMGVGHDRERDVGPTAPEALSARFGPGERLVPRRQRRFSPAARQQEGHRQRNRASAHHP